ncbi:MAG: zinc dependent phospholipase C family protein [Cytophagales bacterium]|nr:zinc dependent phospholipase C family protein [Cytophagales bacterium]
MRIIIVCFLLILNTFVVNGWGFFAHQRINRLAVFTLPPEMVTFYKTHIVYLTENAVNPDNRRYTVEGEAPRHYIDADLYGDSAIYKLPRYWKDAVEKYGEDSLMENGINPWFVNRMRYQLTDAFKKVDGKAILRISADLGHYIADGNVPLHSTHNYNGQYSGQYGIHGFWESRLPELFAKDYDFFVGQAQYLKNTQLRAWQATTEAHLALDSVFGFEKLLTKKFTEDKKYGYEERNGQTVRVYSKDFSKAYHDMLNGQVERRMRASIKMIGDFWYTAWVDAGQPDLSVVIDLKFTEEEKQEMERERNQWKEDAKIRSESFVPGVHHMYEHDCCCSFMHLLTYKNLQKTKLNADDDCDKDAHDKNTLHKH